MTEPPIVPFPTSPYCQVRARVASIWAVVTDTYLVATLTSLGIITTD